MFGDALLEFFVARRNTFVRPHSSGFTKFLEWVITEAEKREVSRANLMTEGISEAAVATALSSSTLFSKSCCEVFDYLCTRRHAKAGGTVASLQNMPWEDRKKLANPQTQIQMVGACFRWAKILVRYTVNGSRLDTRCFQMWKVIGTHCRNLLRTPTNEIETPNLNCGRIFDNKVLFGRRCNPCDLTVLIYVFALCHLNRTQFVFPKGRKRNNNRTKRADDPYVILATVLQKVIDGWSTFAVLLGFQTLDEMVFPNYRVDQRTGNISLISEHSQVSPKQFCRELNFWNSSESVEQALIVSRESEQAPACVRRLSDTAHRHVRSFSKDFIDDVTTLVSNADFYEMDAGSLAQCRELSRYNSDVLGVSLPERFETKIEEQKIVQQCLQRSEAEAVRLRLEEAHEAHIEQRRSTGSALRRNPSVHFQASSEVFRPQECPVGCTCSEIDDIIKPHCLLVESDFKDFIDELSEHEVFFDDETAQLILTEPPQIISNKLSTSRFDHNVMEEGDCHRFADFVFQTLRPGGHLVLFCPSKEFWRWHSIFAGYKTRESNQYAFSVTGTSLIFAYDKTGETSPAPSISQLHEDDLDYALHLFRPKDTHEEEEAIQEEDWNKRAQRTRHGYVSSVSPPDSVLLDNIPQVTDTEAVPEEPDESGHRFPSKTNFTWLRLEQKSIELCRELVCRYTNPGDIVLDPFGGTFPAAEACLSVSSPRQFRGGDRDKACVSAGNDRCLRAFVTRIVEEKNPADIFGLSSKQISAALCYYERHFRAFDEFGTARRAPGELLRIPHADLPSTQVLPHQMLCFVSSLLKDPGVLTPCPPNQWPRPLRASFNALNMKAIQSAECARNSLTLTSSSVLIAARHFKKSEIIGFYFGNLLFKDMMDERAKSPSLGFGAHKVTRAMFESHHVPLLKSEQQIQFKNISLSSIFLVPAPYCPFYSASFNRSKEDTNAALFVKPSRSMKDITCASHVTVRASKPIAKKDPIVLFPCPHLS